VQPYIVRVYSSNSDNNNDVAGIVEQAETQQQPRLLIYRGYKGHWSDSSRQMIQQPDCGEQSGSDELVVNENAHE
jgi:hypothetical protein